MNNFNPNSHDAQFSRILQILEDQNKAYAEKRAEDREEFKAIKAKQDLTNGRVNGLENREKYLLGKIAGIGLVAGTLAGYLFK